MSDGMRVFVGQSRGREWIKLLESHGFGEMTCRGELPPRRTPWVFDNGAFKDWTAGRPFDVAAYEQQLDYLALHCNTRPQWMVVPDIVAGGLASLDFSLSWLKRLAFYKTPLYLAVQDGMETEHIREHLPKFAGLFVGGSLEWKLRTAEKWVAVAHWHGLKCHIGRVGTENRVRWARRIGADSIDSCLPLWSEENLGRFLRGLQPHRNRDFFLEMRAA